MHIIKSYLTGMHLILVLLKQHQAIRNLVLQPTLRLLQIRKEDIDFHQYYTNGRLEDLKLLMDEKLYPPRRKARVQAKHNSFFESSNAVDYCLVFDKKCIPGKIITPCHNYGR